MTTWQGIVQERELSTQTRNYNIIIVKKTIKTNPANIQNVQHQILHWLQKNLLISVVTMIVVAGPGVGGGACARAQGEPTG